MPDYAQMILELRRKGITSRIIVLWGHHAGRSFSANALKSIVQRGSTKIRHDIAVTIEDLHKRLCT